MKKTPKLTPLFVALSLVLSALPTGALAQVVARPIVGSASSVGAAAASINGFSAVSAITPLTTLAPSALSGAPALTATLSAPSIAPQAAPASALAAAAPLAAAPALAAAPVAAMNGFDATPATMIRTPGAAATGVAVEAAAYAADAQPTSIRLAAETEVPAPARASLVSRLSAVVTGKASVASLFDASVARPETKGPVMGGMSLTEHKPLVLPNGSHPDEQPTIPSPDRETTVKSQAYSFPGARDTGGILESSRKVLSVDPTDVTAVVSAVKAIIDAEPARYGVNSSELRLINARRFEGRGDQADSIFIHFRQIKDNMLVNGSNMSFTLKVIGGKATVVAQTGQVYPNIEVDTQATMTEDQIMSRISERVGISVADAQNAFQFSEEKIVYSRGAWRHVKLYVAEGLPFMIAVDLASGMVFAWDNRTGAQSPSAASASAAGTPRMLVNLTEKGLPIERVHELLSGHGVRITGYRAEDGSVVVTPAEEGASVSALMASLRANKKVSRVTDASKKGAPGVGGTIAGKAVDHGPILPTAKIAELPLSYLNLTIGGKTYTTDKDGKFTAPGLEIAPEGLTLTATLSGPFVNVQDSTGKTLTISVTLKPGDGAIQVMFNKDSTLSDENALAQVAAFHKVNLAYNFLKARNLTTAQMDKNPITVRTNVDDECNAYYTPGSPSLNFFKSSANCVNSAYDTVADHEYGHYWDDMTGGIMNGGLSEGWGDILSMYLLNNPIIGEHFLKVARNGVDYIRHGENTYQYNEYDEVHDQGQAWQGFGWKLRKALMKQLGDAEGAAVAEALVLPTMFAKAATIPDAMAQVLVNAMKKDGTIQYEDLIRATAKIHGITLPQNPGKGLVQSLVERFTAPLRKVGLLASSFEGGAASGAASAQGLQELAAGAQAPSVRATLKFTAGALLRTRVANEIRRYMDETGLKYELHEYKSWTSTDYLLVIEGPQDKVQEHTENISRWLNSIARGN
jgi:hypothetical protein